MTPTRRGLVPRTLKTLALPFLVVALFALLTGGRSLSWTMLLVTMQQSVVPIILSMALVCNMSLGMWDFSAGGVILAASILGVNFMKLTETGMAGFVLSVLCIAILMATLTGFLNNLLRLPAIVLTIGLVLIYETIPRVLFPAGATLRLKYTFLSSSPYCFAILAVMVLLFHLVYTYTAYGHNVRALAGSVPISRSAGLDEARIKQVGFSFSGVFLGVGAILYMSSNGQLLNVTALGSVASIFGAMMGVFLAFFLSRYCSLSIALVVGTFTMTAMTNGFVALGLSGTLRDIITGLFLLVLLCISANQGRYTAWRMDRKRARIAAETAALARQPEGETSV